MTQSLELVHNTKPTSYSEFYVKDAPEILHVIKSGFKDRYYYFWQDAYETEPYQSGVRVASKAELKTKYGIEL